MDIFIIVTFIFSILSTILVSYLIYIQKRGNSSSVSNDGIEAIRKSVIGTMNDMSALVSSNIASSNKELTTEIKTSIEKLERDMSSLKEALASNHINMIENNTKNNDANIKRLNDALDIFSKALTEKLEFLSKSVEKNLDEIRKQNNEKLESIQKTVDEKLENTLSTRLKTSFDNVIKQIGDVNIAVGEIKGIAKDVSSLNKVLTNVKTKGIVGEISLGNIISETLTKEQYETNIVTKKDSRDPVEFAVKMPGANDDFVYMPIDSKFPLEAYHLMKDASDELNKEKYDSAKKLLRSNLKKFAKDIHDKYIDPPNTTDFAIMFLPIEGLYVEALDMGLFEELQREYKINIAGPSTLTALLNALQMGFKSLIIQKRSGEVFDLLAAVKTEFNKFAEVLGKAQKKYDEASEEIGKLVTTRTKAITRKLNSITELSDDDATKILGIEND